MLTQSGVNSAYNMVTNIYYLQNNISKLYRINGGEWQNYKNNTIKLNIGDKIEAKGIGANNIETPTVSYTSALNNDALGIQAYDKNSSSYIDLYNSSKYINIDSSMQGEYLNLIKSEWANESGRLSNVIFYNNSGTILKSYAGEHNSVGIFYALPNRYNIPVGTTRVLFKMSTRGGFNLYEITPEIVSASPSLFSSFFAVPSATTTEPTFTASPEITVSNSDVWSTSKDITISYPSGYTNEYSLDGENWQAYTSSIKVTEPTTIFARAMDGEKVISSSSYQITKIDTTTPTINLDGVPTSINLGSDYSLPTSYTVDNNKSGGSAVCTINGTAYTSTSTLPLGTYTINCTVTTGAGIMASTSKNVEVAQIKVVTETTPSPIDTTTIKGDETNVTGN
jgi:hypothetical protein